MEVGKRNACLAALKNITKTTRVIGLGSGTTITYLLPHLVSLSLKQPLTFIPTSFQSKQLLIENKLTVSDLAVHSRIDVTFDGADEVSVKKNMIKGGGGCLFQEKLVASCSKELMIIIDSSKGRQVLGKRWRNGVPIEVVAMSLSYVTTRLQEMGGVVILRMAVRKAGPVVTDNGNFILDVDFGEIEDDKVQELNIRILGIVGVYETGLFVGMADKVYVGHEDGTVEEM